MAAKKAAKQRSRPAPRPPKVVEDGFVSNVMLDHAFEMARRIKARAVFIYADAIPDSCITGLQDEPFDIYLVTRNAGPSDLGVPAERVISVPDIALPRMTQVKFPVMMALSKNQLSRGDRIVCLTGVPQYGALDTLVVLQVGREMELISSSEVLGLEHDLAPGVFSTVVRLAVEIANEGDEGKPLGTTFVIGHAKEVKEHVRQLILNPFKGYSESERRILDPRIQKTIKRFASLDGAFIIRPDGVVETAGTFLESRLLSEELPQGLGARHYSAAAMTAATKAIAVTVSESTGDVRVFKNGKIVIEIEKAQPPTSSSKPAP